MLYDSENMTEEQYKTHLSITKDIFNSLGNYYNFNYVYIDTDPNTCYERMLSRDRKGEKNSYNLEYIKTIDVYQKNLIKELKKNNIYINVQVYDGLLK